MRHLNNDCMFVKMIDIMTELTEDTEIMTGIIEIMIGMIEILIQMTDMTGKTEMTKLLPQTTERRFID